MVGGTSTHWDRVEQWSPTLFLVGGGLLGGHTAVQGIEAFTALAPPPDVFVTTGHLVALAGLVGLYPALVDRTPRLARAGVIVAALGLVGWLVMTVVRFLAVAEIVTSLSAVFPDAFFMLVLGSMILTYALFGGATLRVDGSSRTVGLLVLAPVALIIMLMGDAAVTGTSAVDGVVIGGGLALSMLALGYRLRTWNHPSGRTAPAGDTTAG